MQDGSECDVVFAIFQKSLRSTAARVLTAFTRDSIRGSVYVEAPSLVDVRLILDGIPRVLRSQPIDLVALADRTPLLTMEAFISIRALSWVRIKRSGRYKNDLGFVHSVDSRTSIVDVYVVPRIQLDLNQKRKRKRKTGDSRGGRPAAALFDNIAVAECYGEETVERLNQVYWFKGDIYKNGLLDGPFSPSNLSAINVNPTPHELELFRGSQNEAVLGVLKLGVVSLHVGDRIKVITGTFTGLSGRLVEMKEDSTIIFETDDTRRHETYASEIRKYFSRGDYVRVLYGDLHGKEEFIIELGSKSAVVFECSAGEEVCPKSNPQ